MTPEAARLKQLALERYNIDGGYLCECSDDSDYEALIAKHGTAEAAWTAHLDTLEIQKENGGYYERF